MKGGEGMYIRKKLDEMARSLAHIESLLQHMPEIIAAEAVIEQEQARKVMMTGKCYSDTVKVIPPSER